MSQKYEKLKTLLDDAMAPDLNVEFGHANPRVDIPDPRGGRLQGGKRWQCGAPPLGRARFAQVQHLTHRSGGGGACDTWVVRGPGVA